MPTPISGLCDSDTGGSRRGRPDRASGSSRGTSLAPGRVGPTRPTPAGSISAPHARPGYEKARLPGRLIIQTLEGGSLLRVAFPGICLFSVLLPLSESQIPWGAA